MLKTVTALAGLAAAAMQVSRRVQDERVSARAWSHLARRAQGVSACFDPAQVAGLPEPARRFFLYAITRGAPLRSGVEITMRGRLSLGTRQAPKFQAMHAHQILAAPYGLVWRVEAGEGLLRMSGSDGMADGTSWTRFWLCGLLPVVRAGGNLDHLRSSFGRVIAEAAFWSPAALLPQPHVTWSAVDADTARATVRHAGLRQEVDIHVDANGRPEWVCLPRWSNANARKEFRLQPFGGHVSDFRLVDGYRVPFRVEGGNFFGTPDYFPFYQAEVSDLRFIAGDDVSGPG